MSGLAGIGASIALKAVGVGNLLKPVGAVLKRVPPKVWYVLLGIAALLAGYFIHQHIAHKRLSEANQAGYDRRKAEDATVIAALRSRARTAEANFATIAQKERTRHEQETRANAAAADAMLVRGPGAARCGYVGHSSLSTAAGGRQLTAPQTGAAVAGLPDQERVDLIGLPFAGAVQGAREHDDLLSEVRAWHSWYPQVLAELERLRNAKPTH